MAIVDLRHSLKTDAFQSNYVGIFSPHSIELDDYDYGYPDYGDTYIFARGDASYRYEESSYNVRYYGDFDYSSEDKYLDSKLTSAYSEYGKWGTIILRDFDIRVRDILGDEVTLYEKALRDDDIIFGSSFTDLIAAKGGDDVVYSGSGDDDIYGDHGNDVLEGESGSDMLDGGRGNDRLIGGAGVEADNLFGSDGDDFLGGGGGPDHIYGQADTDEIRAGHGKDLLSGGSGSDTLYGGGGTNTFLSELDGSVDDLFILSDFRGHGHDWGRNHGGINADVIQELDTDDRITILGTTDSELSFRKVVAGTHNQSQAGIGIFDGEMLEAIYVGSNLDANQLDSITGADLSRFW